MKVSELSGAWLDYWVARANGWTFGPPHKIHEWDVWRDSAGEIVGTIPASGYTPSTDWAQAGPIIERERINLTWLEPLEDWRAAWSAQIDILPRCIYNGDTPLIAAMRAYVASEFGDEVPDEVAS